MSEMKERTQQRRAADRTIAHADWRYQMAVAALKSVLREKGVDPDQVMRDAFQIADSMAVEVSEQ